LSPKFSKPQFPKISHIVRTTPNFLCFINFTAVKAFVNTPLLGIFENKNEGLGIVRPGNDYAAPS